MTADSPGRHLVGTLGSPSRAEVDGAGTVYLAGGDRDGDRHVDSDSDGDGDGRPGDGDQEGTVVRWWIGAEDRWHLPEHEVAVRQHLVGGSPVIETAMRVPGGDAVERVYAVPAPEASAVIVEIQNASPTPVALAIAVERPPDAVAAPLVASRAAAQHRSATLSTGSHLDVHLFPLPHTATVRVAFGLDAALAAMPDPLPGAQAVAKGWEAQGGRGVRVDFPDPDAAAALDVARRQLLLVERGDGRVVGAPGREAAIVLALDRLGFHTEAERVLVRLAEHDDPTDDPASLLAAIDLHTRATRNDALARALVDLGARGLDAARQAEAPLAASAFEAAARLFDRAGEKRAARTARAEGAGAPSAVASVEPRSPEEAMARRVVDTLDRLIRFEASDGTHGDALVLCPEVPRTWLGQGWEVHEAPTPSGRCSYAVRWHGERPALLWQVDHDGPLTLRAPALDPGWVSTESRGEALLAAVSPAVSPGVQPVPDAGSFS